MLEKVPNSTAYVVRAVKKILKPLVNLSISNGITYPELSEMLKEIYVEVAESEFKLGGKQQTDSRINFLTGIHRKDVKRLKNKALNSGDTSSTTSLSALLVSRWLGDPDYCDNQHNPLALPRLIKQGGKVSFEGLVVAINKDIRSRAILDEWLNMGIVYFDKNDSVCLNQKAFIPRQGHEEKVWFFGENLHDHLAAAVHNLKDTGLPLLDRAVYYDQLTKKSVLEVQELSEKLGMEALIKINSRALVLQNKDKKRSKAEHRIRLGLYFYKTTDENDKKTQEKNKD